MSRGEAGSRLQKRRCAAHLRPSTDRPRVSRQLHRVRAELDDGEKFEQVYGGDGLGEMSVEPGPLRPAAGVGPVKVGDGGHERSGPSRVRGRSTMIKSGQKR